MYEPAGVQCIPLTVGKYILGTHRLSRRGDDEVCVMNQPSKSCLHRCGACLALVRPCGVVRHIHDRCQEITFFSVNTTSTGKGETKRNKSLQLPLLLLPANKQREAS